MGGTVLVFKGEGMTIDEIHQAADRLKGRSVNLLYLVRKWLAELDPVASVERHQERAMDLESGDE